MARESAKLRWLLFGLSIIAAFGGLLFGYDTGVISGAILFIKKDFDLTTFQESTIVSIVAIGALFGAIFGGPLSDKIGRKITVLTSSIIFILSAIILVLSPTIGWLITGRFIVGFAIGVTSATAPLYIAELAPLSMRGALVTLNQLAITIGILLAYIAGVALAKTQGWRVMFGLACIPAAIQFIVMLFFPKSPRWLAVKKGHDAALTVLKKYRATSQDAELELDYLEKTSKQREAKWKTLFKPKIRPALMAGIGLTIIQQVTGINTIIYFAPTIFRLAGFATDESAILATSWVGVTNVLMTFVAIWLLDKVGRKPLLYTGLGGMCLSLITLGFAFQYPSVFKGGLIFVICLILYVAFFAFSLGPIAWLINSEVYPLKVRGRGMGLATSVNWASNFIITMTFLTLINLFGEAGTFWLYAAVGLLGLWYIKRYVPETKFRSLEDIENTWVSKS